MADLFETRSAWKVLEKALNISAERHRLITNNIANIDTIGYNPKDLDFKQALQEALKNRTDDLIRTHPKHIAKAPASYAVQTQDDMQEPKTVNIDQEMTHLVENNIKYRTSIEMLLRKINMLTHSISEAGK